MTTSRSLRLGESEYERFRELVRERSGLDLAESRRSDLNRTLLQALIETVAPSIDGLYNLLTGDEGRRPLERLIARLTIGETYFFRNRPQFQALEQVILPALIETHRDSRTLRIWSAGCATGEEPYSVAILLERLLPDIADWKILLLATDLISTALEKAQRGVYGNWSFRDVPPEILERYFIPRGERRELVPSIRARVTFAQLNLVEDVFPSFLNHTTGLDLILCRNVLIYFREETTRRVVARLHDALRQDSWLIVGHAEPSQAVFHQFHTHNFPGATIYQKISQSVVFARDVQCSSSPQSPRTEVIASQVRFAMTDAQFLSRDPSSAGVAFNDRNGSVVIDTNGTVVIAWNEAIPRVEETASCLAVTDPQFLRRAPSHAGAAFIDTNGTVVIARHEAIPRVEETASCLAVTDARLIDIANAPVEHIRERDPPQPSPARMNVEHALELWQAGETERAQQLLETLAGSATADARPAYLIAKIHANGLRFDDALRWIEQALKQNSLFAPAHYLRGLIFQEQGRAQEALEALRRCVYADAEFALGHFALAQLLSRSGQRTRSHKALHNVTRLVAARERTELVPEGDGLTVGRLLELVALLKDNRYE